VTFAARGLVVSLAFFAVLYSLLSLLVIVAGQTMQRLTRKPSWSSPNLLFGLRIFPFAGSMVVTLFFTFPSFWLMERTSPDEDFETYVLALCALLMLSAGLFRVLRAQARTNRAIDRWSKPHACSDAPPLILVGVLKPRVLISDEAVTMLSEGELEVAVRHELGHKRSWDNLRKVLVSLTPFPGARALENAWLEAAEIAADDAAVTNRHEALDLAAALIKLSRSSKPLADSVLATALVSGSSSIGVRVERLLKWHTDSRHLQRTWPWIVPVLLAIAVVVAGNYAATLALTHRLTELLVP
jgi:Zn-dependent protease with chaperone function